MNGDQMNGALSDKTSKSGANGRTKGFGNFFKRGSNKKAEKNARAQGEQQLEYFHVYSEDKKKAWHVS